MVFKKHKALKKELTLIDVYAIGTGTTISAGFFLLPGFAAAQAGPAVIISYLLAAIAVIPAMFSMMEMATAMPRAGGTYYFLDRSMGPLMGTIGGLGTWLSLMLKVSFALIGVGAYLNLFIDGDYIKVFAVVFAIFFGAINLGGAKASGSVQVILVGGIIFLLTGFIGNGMFHVSSSHFEGFFDSGASAIISTAGMVYISYSGITKIASVAEEIKNPERNIPLAMILSFLTAAVAYGFGTYVMVGVLPHEQLITSLTPVADTAEKFFGFWGKLLVTIAAIFAFFSVANAGILSSSRFPLAMSRDHLLSKMLRKLTKKGIPANSVLLTLLCILFFILFLNPMKIAKLASAFQLLVFGLCCLAVIIMRESKIEAYDPGYKSPFYPWMQIVGMLIAVWLIGEMGTMIIVFSVGLILAAVGWYYIYARKKVIRKGAILHVFQRLGEYKHEGLEPELRVILKEKGLRDEDPFDHLVASARIMDINNRERFDNILIKASKVLSQQVAYSEEEFIKELLDGAKVGGTPVERGVALPHIRLPNISEPELLMVRCSKGVDLELGDEFWGNHKPEGDVFAVFILVSPDENPKLHLRFLAKLAGLVDDREFMELWLAARDEQELKELLLRTDNFASIHIKNHGKSSQLIGHPLKEMELPEDTLVAMINRSDKIIVPKGSTVLEDGDRITVIGEPKGIKKFKEIYGGK